ncbi:hypothetical protein C7212DRAFT_341584 [Tuber magnatum]|uniref:Uncharacterized protein n=1 Tax=Tuber magnatum TaxID=42249 RepID=A0A317SXG0_9PEZI|nr:hypothetical protein C7212DRAFT_341584 [Tuber magnatum]
MDTNSMWVLPSGDLAEQVLYEGHRTTPYECLPHSFIIDLADPTVQKLYKPKDWVAICERVPKLPKKDESLGEVMRKFENLESPEQLRRILIESSYVPKVELYNHDMHYDASWVHLVFNFLLPLYDDPYPVLLEDHPEAWFDINIWSVVVDRCLQGLRGINMLRKETTSLAGSLRRNRDRTYPTQRQKMGPRYDGLAMDRSNRIEYAVMETSKAFHLEGATKWLHDYLKVAKCLHDILFLLHCEVNHEASLLEELQVAGLVSAGLDCQVLRMSYGGGYVCILSREKRRTIPATLSKSGQLLKLLFSIWRFKTIVDSCGRDDTEQDSHARLMSSPSLSYPKILRAFDTETEGE